MEKVVRELLFDGAGNWLFTKTEMSYAALPAVVKQALDASEYAVPGDDVDHYRNFGRGILPPRTGVCHG